MAQSFSSVEGFVSQVLKAHEPPDKVQQLQESELERKSNFLQEAGAMYRPEKELQDLREQEFKRLEMGDDGPLIYLDAAGSSLPQESHLQETCSMMQRSVYGNPHSLSTCSKRTQRMVEATRDEVLKFFNTDDDDCDVVFTHNATAGLKLIAESFPWEEGSVFMYTVANHTSVLGIREYALSNGATVLALSNEDLEQLLTEPHGFVESKKLPESIFQSNKTSSPPPLSMFAFPGEDNFHGGKFPQELTTLLRHVLGSHFKILLDAASLAPNTGIDLSAWAADFVAVSFYKMIGYPPLGAMLIKRPEGYCLKRPYFGGGSVVESTSSLVWHTPKEFPNRFEDGTVPFLNILALNSGLRRLQALGMGKIESHSYVLSRYLAHALASLRHSNDNKVCIIYGNHFSSIASQIQGPIVTFNVLDPSGQYVKLSDIVAQVDNVGIQVRAGVLCNPGSCFGCLNIPDSSVASLDFANGCGWDDLVNGVPMGAVRASVGYYNAWEDVDKLYTIIKRIYVK